MANLAHAPAGWSQLTAFAKLHIVGLAGSSAIGLLGQLLSALLSDEI
jgi:hypothetical protein